ncbi:MAG: hypothetical protein AAB487_02150, partial [Patescibacteria group bacterium]
GGIPNSLWFGKSQRIAMLKYNKAPNGWVFFCVALTGNESWPEEDKFSSERLPVLLGAVDNLLLLTEILF